MARVDKKPIYTGEATSLLGAWCGMLHDLELSSRFITGTTVDIARARTSYLYYENADAADLDPSTDPASLMILDRTADRDRGPRQLLGRQWLKEISRGHDCILEGNRAAVHIAYLYMARTTAIGSLRNHHWATKVAASALTVSSQDAALPADAAETVGKAHFEGMQSRAVSAQTAAWNFRDGMLRPAPRSVFKNASSIMFDHKYFETYRRLLAERPKDRFVWENHFLDKWVKRVWYANGVLVVDTGKALCLLSAEARRTAVRTVQSACNAIVWSSLSRLLNETGRTYRMDPQLCYASCVEILKGADQKVLEGKSHTHVAKSLARRYYGEVQAASEGDDFWDDHGRRRAELLFEDSFQLWDGIRMLLQSWSHLGVEDKMEALKLGNILPSDDADPREMVKRLDEGKRRKRVAKKERWDDFLNFCAAYDLTIEASHAKKMPNFGGDAPPEKWVLQVTSGRFVLPERHLWGKTWIQDHYQVSHNGARQWMDPQDVTHISRGPDNSLKVSNEMVEAWKNGPNIDGIRAYDEAKDAALLTGSDLYWAAKMENTKDRDKQRLTASADAATRAVLSGFETMERSISYTAPGFAQGVDAFTLNGRIQQMVKHAEEDSAGFVSSHDIEGWSEFEDRDAKMRYVMYEASKFKDANALAACRVWEKMHSWVDKAGVKWDGKFTTGGVQGFLGACDTMLHAKIVAYIHQIATERNIAHRKANLMCCIDDVVYDIALTGRNRAEYVEPLKRLIREVYTELSYPLDEKKTIEGRRKFIFLADAYIGPAKIPAPLRVAIKANVDESCAIRTVHTDTYSWVSTAQATALAGGSPFTAYIFGIYLAAMHLAHQEKQFPNVNPATAAVWMMAPQAEGGLGLPCFRTFLCGADTDVSFAWRDMLEGLERTKHPAYSGAMHAYNAILHAPVAPRSPLEVLCNPLSVKRMYPASGEQKRMAMCSNAVWGAKHHPIWDQLRDAGIEWGNAWAEAVADSSCSVDSVTCADIANAFPNKVVDSIIEKFATTKALPKLIGRRATYKIARAVSRADTAYLHFWVLALQQSGRNESVHAYSDTYIARMGSNCAVRMFNNIIPTARSAMAVSGTVLEGQATAKFEAGRTGLPPGMTRQDCRACHTGPEVGMKSSSIDWEEMAGILRSDPISGPVVQAAAVLRLLKMMGADVSTTATMLGRSWGIDRDISDLNVVKGSGNVKRIAAVTSARKMVAMAHRNVLGASSVGTNRIWEFVNEMVAHSIVDPQEVGFQIRMLVTTVGMFTGTQYARDIRWMITPASTIDWAYEVPFDAYFIPLEYAPELDKVQLPTEVTPDIANLEAISKQINDPDYEVYTDVPESIDVTRVAAVIYEEIARGPVIGPKTRSLKVKKSPLGISQHSHNLAATAVISARTVEECNSRSIDVGALLAAQYGDEDSVPVDVPFIASAPFWDKVLDDLRHLEIDPDTALSAAINRMTGTNRNWGTDAHAIASAMGQSGNLDSRVRICTRSYDGLVGTTWSAFRNPPRYIKLSNDPDTANRKERRRIAQARTNYLLSEYQKRLQKLTNAERQAFMQGRIAVRTMVEYEGDVQVLCNRSKAEAHLSLCSGSAQSLDPDSWSNELQDAIRVVERANNRIRKPGWDAGSFNAGMQHEARFIDPDCADLRNRDYYMEPAAISDPHTKFVLKAEPPPVATPEGVEADVWGAIMAQVMAAEEAREAGPSEAQDELTAQEQRTKNIYDMMWESDEGSDNDQGGIIA